MKTFRPFVWDDAVAELLNVTVTVAGAADAAAGNDSAATAPSATTPERGRRIKALILDSIFILSFLRGRAGNTKSSYSAGTAANRHRLPVPADDHVGDLGLVPSRPDRRQLGEPDQQVTVPGRPGDPECVRAAYVFGGGHGGEGRQGRGSESAVVAGRDRHVGSWLGAEGHRDRPDPDRPAHVQDQAAARLEAAEDGAAEVVLALPVRRGVPVDGVPGL